MTTPAANLAADPRGLPLPLAVRLDELGPLAAPIAEHGGQARAIHPLERHPGWLAKLYRQPRPADDARRLDLLLSAPGSLPAEDRSALYAATCWPAARIFSPENATVGCVIPVAPEEFRHELRLGAQRERRFVEIDWLAKPDESIERRGLAAPGQQGRLLACTRLTAVAALLESMGLVYSDWSYSNAFWNPQSQAVYLIDVDGCQPEKTADIHQPNWADPLTSVGVDADRYTDRYRIALMTARCLTGQRDARALHGAAGPWPAQSALGEVLLDMLCAADRDRRPSAAQLHLALAGGPYVRPVPRPTRLPLPPLPQPAPSVRLPQPLRSPQPQKRKTKVPATTAPGGKPATAAPGRRNTSKNAAKTEQKQRVEALIGLLAVAALIILLATISTH